MKPQMELSFEQSSLLRIQVARQRRLRRAHWWFEQMRQVVDRALDRTADLPARPEQVYLQLERRA
jgi:hypothetical protein